MFPCGRISFYLKDVGFSLAVDTCEGGVNGSFDSPHILDEFGVTRKNGLVIQLKKIFTYRRKRQVSGQCYWTIQEPCKKGFDLCACAVIYFIFVMCEAWTMMIICKLGHFSELLCTTLSSFTSECIGRPILQLQKSIKRSTAAGRCIRVCRCGPRYGTEWERGSCVERWRDSCSRSCCRYRHILSFLEGVTTSN